MSLAISAEPGYRVQFEPSVQSSMAQLPQGARELLWERLRVIADLAQVLPPFNPLWLGVAASGLPRISLEVGEYRIGYEVDQQLHAVVVRELRRCVDRDGLSRDTSPWEDSFSAGVVSREAQE